MGQDDGSCEVSLDGEHVLELTDLVVNERGLINQVHRCVGCGATVFDVSADQEARARPPL